MKRKKALPVIPREPVRIVVLGLDGAGKSSILACISGQDVGSVTKTTGFVMKEMPFAGTSATIVDIGGSVQLRPYWNRYYKLLDSVLFVVDSSQRERLQEARQVLWDHVLSAPELRSSPLLVLAAKSDRSVCTEEEITQALDLPRITGRFYKVISCSISEPERVKEAVTLLIEEQLRWRAELLQSIPQ